MTKTILLADDSVTIQKVIELTFMDQDCEVVAVSTGDEAVDRLAEMQPDLVIADVHMPGANGYEVARQSKDRYPGVPVLLLVGTFEPFDEGEMAASGADSHLKKPFDSHELMQLVDRLLQSAAASAPSPASAAQPSAPQPAAAPPAAAPRPPGPTAVPPPAPQAAPSAAPPSVPPASGAETVRLDSLDLESYASQMKPPAQPSEAVEGPDPTWGNLDLEEIGDEEASLSAAEAPAEAAPVEAEAEGTPFRLTDSESESFSLEPEESYASDSPEGDDSFELEEEPEAAAPAAATPAGSETDGTPVAAVPVTGLSDDDVERIARRVAEMVGEKAVKEVAWEIIPDLAEVLIKDRIQQLESQVEKVE